MQRKKEFNDHFEKLCFQLFSVNIHMNWKCSFKALVMYSDVNCEDFMKAEYKGSFNPCYFFM